MRPVCRLCRHEMLPGHTFNGTTEWFCQYCDRVKCGKCGEPEPTGKQTAKCASCGNTVGLFAKP